jgi:hypothetical protein
MEPKELISDRLGYSPDDADGFVLTFAQPVQSKIRRPQGRSRHQSEWDFAAAMDSIWRRNEGAVRGMSVDFDPFV